MPVGSKNEICPWQILSSTEVFAALPWVKVFEDKVKLPSGRVVDNYYRVGLLEYAMICGRREDGKILFLRQYRHALNKVVLALPAGSIEKGESPEIAAKREFLEETGYRADVWNHVGSFVVDGNKGCGRAHFYIAEKLEKISNPVEDDTEEAETIFLSEGEAVKAVLTGAAPSLATVSLVAIATNTKFNNSLQEPRN